MKKWHILTIASALMALTSCADLGFGVDLDSSDYSPYWYGNGYLGNTYWDTPVWNYGPIYDPLPPRPPRVPIINNGMSPELPPPSVRPSIRPAQRPDRPQINFPNNGGNDIPTSINGMMRPGNGGFATPSSSSLR